MTESLIVSKRNLFTAFLGMLLTVVSVGLEVQAADLDAKFAETLSGYANRITETLTSSLRPRTGAGTGYFMNSVNEMALEMARDPHLVREGVNLNDELRKLFVGPNGEPKIEEADAPKGYCDYLNNRLVAAGMDFLQTKPSQKARLLELYYQLGSVGFDEVDLQEMINLSKGIYPGLESDQLMVPIFDENTLAAVYKKLETHPQRKSFPKLRLVKDPSITTEDQVVLPNPESPLAHEAFVYKTIARIRSIIAVPLAAVGTAAGGHFTAGSYVAAASPIGQEVNFIFTSTKWNGFWKKFGLRGNFAINAQFGALVTSFAILGAALTSGIQDSSLKIGATIALAATSFVGSYYALELVKYRTSLKTIAGLIGGMAALAFFGGKIIDLNVGEFFLKGLGLNTMAFFATFGGAQILGGKLHGQGELSEGRRFPYLESSLNIFAGTARGIALGAMASGLALNWFNINDFTGPMELLGINWANIAFNKTEIISWVAQLTVGLLVTAPLALRAWKGNQAIDLQTREALAGPNASSAGATSWLKNLCLAPLRGIARLYTPSRTKVPAKK